MQRSWHELLIPEIRRLHSEESCVYGVRKMYALLRRQDWILGRDQTGQLMRLAGVRGEKRSKKVFTTKTEPTSTRTLRAIRLSVKHLAEHFSLHRATIWHQTRT
ncbi:IS3 family transposase [Leucobacter iarius]|uniref:HTH-like domain-containing protein n=1 Tax=Leucobacter iarius TaxID=333963 RepID=A0ABP4XY18_9MICO